jgi:putative transposase
VGHRHPCCVARRCGVDLIRDAVRLVMQELIELEAVEVIGAHRYERTDTRVNERNGHRPRTLATQAGAIELKIPKVAHGSFFPSLLGPRRQIDHNWNVLVSNMRTY